MGILAIANIIDGKNTIGLRLLDTVAGTMKDVTVASIVLALSQGKTTIDNIELSNGVLVGSNGSIDRLPKLFNGQLVGTYSPVIIVNQIEDKGYTITGYKGKMVKLKNEDALKYAKQQGIANGKVVNKDGKEFISSINGEYPNVSCEEDSKRGSINIDKNTGIYMEEQKDTRDEHKETREEQKERIRNAILKKVESENGEGKSTPRIEKKKLKPTESRLGKEITCDGNMTVEQKISRTIVKMKLIHPFYFAIYSLLKRVETLDVSTMGVDTKTLYYNPYFVQKLKEGELNFINLHEIAHIAMLHTLRRKERDPEIFNIACDLYINKVLSEEFKIKPGQSVKVEGLEITMPEFGCYCDEISIENDTPEIIYDAIIAEMKNQMQGGGSSLQGNKDASESGGGEGEGEGKEQKADGGDGSSTAKNSQGGSESEKCREVTYKGRKYRLPADRADLLDVEKNGREKAMEETAAKQLLEQALIRTHGTGAGLLERLVKEVLAPKLDWKKLLRNQLIEITKSISTLARPDKRFMSRHMTLPGPKQCETDKLKGVKVCIDTSASIGDEELGTFYAQIKELLKTYQVEAEVIYWDTEVANRAEFKTIKEFERVKVKGGGGTDVNCVFNYFESRSCKNKPSVVLIFTDGYFGAIDTKFHRKYKNTIWVVVGNPSFSPEFGKVAPFKQIL